MPKAAGGTRALAQISAPASPALSIETEAFARLDCGRTQALRK